jgi:hypothetical protein
MTPELRKIITERYTGWASTWGLSLAYAITQSAERAERLTADAIAALITSEFESHRKDLSRKEAASFTIPPSVNAVRLAAVLWDMAEKEAYRGFGTDAFFRMPAIARAIVVLKARGQFSVRQIAAALHLTMVQVEDHLENSRLLFSDGRSWLEASPSLLIEGKRWVPDCPQWNATVPRSDAAGQGDPDIQSVFARYIGKDLDGDTEHKLHSHLIVCASCRTGFAHFKKNYVEWLSSVPVIEADDDMHKHLKRISKMAMKVNRNNPPKVLPGIRRVLSDAQVRAILLSTASLLLIHYFVKLNIKN